MSLPSNIIFYDLYDQRIGEYYCNCGMFFTISSMFNCFEAPFGYEDKGKELTKLLKNSYSVELYGFTFFSEMILDFVKCKKDDRKLFVEIMENYFNQKD